MIILEQQLSAMAAFLANIGQISVRLDELKEYAENHMNYAPEEITWAHVGTSANLLASLTELTDQAYHRGEYADKTPEVGTREYYASLPPDTVVVKNYDQFGDLTARDAAVLAGVQELCNRADRAIAEKRKRTIYR